MTFFSLYNEIKQILIMLMDFLKCVKVCSGKSVVEWKKKEVFTENMCRNFKLPYINPSQHKIYYLISSFWIHHEFFHLFLAFHLK